jgi:hypothetical protein
MSRDYGNPKNQPGAPNHMMSFLDPSNVNLERIFPDKVLSLKWTRSVSGNRAIVTVDTTELFMAVARQSQN